MWHRHAIEQASRRWRGRAQNFDFHTGHANVWQPQYTAFEERPAARALAPRQHVQLPGGRDNIGNPDYDLKNETSWCPHRHAHARRAYQKQADARRAPGSRAGAVRVEKALQHAYGARMCDHPDGDTSAVGHAASVLVRGAGERGLRAGRVPRRRNQQTWRRVPVDGPRDAGRRRWTAPRRAAVGRRGRRSGRCRGCALPAVLSGRRPKLDYPAAKRRPSIECRAISNLGLLPPDGDWPRTALTAVAERLAAGAAPPDICSPTAAGLPAHGGPRLSYAVWAVVGGGCARPRRADDGQPPAWRCGGSGKAWVGGGGWVRCQCAPASRRPVSRIRRERRTAEREREAGAEKQRARSSARAPARLEDPLPVRGRHGDPGLVVAPVTPRPTVPPTRATPDRHAAPSSSASLRMSLTARLRRRPPAQFGSQLAARWRASPRVAAGRRRGAPRLAVCAACRRVADITGRRRAGVVTRGRSSPRPEPPGLLRLVDGLRERRAGLSAFGPSSTP